MKVVIVGERSRSELRDYQLVNDTITALQKRYPGIQFITGGTDRGVGKIFSNRMWKDRDPKKDEPESTFVDCQVRIYTVGDLPRAEYAKFYTARNPLFVEAGEEFHLFMDEGDKGYMYDLLQRVKAVGLPHSTYYPGESTGPKMISL